MTTYCTSCGAGLDSATKFCAQCGTPHTAGAQPPTAGASGPIAPSPTGTDAPGRVLPPAATSPRTDSGRAGTPTPLVLPDWRTLVVGNWVGAAVVAAGTAAVAGVLAMMLALLAKPTDFGLDNTLTLATVIATGAFGADLKAAGSASDSGFSGDVTMFAAMAPLLVLLVAVAVGVWLFRRITSGYPSGLLAVGDAARAALIFGFFLLVPALVFTATNDEMGRGWGQELTADSLGVEASIGANPVGAFFMGFLVLFAVLVGAALLRGDWWTGRVATAQRWVAGPVRGAATLLVLSPLAGLVAYAAVLLFGEDTDTEATDGWRPVIAAMIGLVPNAGLWMLSLGTGAPLGATGEATDEPVSRDYERLWGAITDDEPGLRVAPAVALLLLAAVAWVVLRSADHAYRAAQLNDASTTPGAPATGAVPSPAAALVAWVVSLLVVVPVLIRWSSGHASVDSHFGEGSRREAYSASGVFGPDVVQTTLLVVLAAALVALALALATGVLHPQTLKAGLARFGASVQSTPGAARGAGASDDTAGPTPVSSGHDPRPPGTE